MDEKLQKELLLAHGVRGAPLRSTLMRAVGHDLRHFCYSHERASHEISKHRVGRKAGCS